VDCPHIFYGPAQGRPLADKLFLRAGTISLIAERKGWGNLFMLCPRAGKA